MNFLESIHLEKTKKIFERKGYKFFDKGVYNLNIFGIRKDTNNPNSFDDLICVIFKDRAGEWFLKNYEATTDPGKYWLEQPMNPKGTAILVPGQYRSAWEKAKHQGRYDALCQRKPVKVWRDNNKDSILDFNNEIKESGLFGINIHRSNPYTESYAVEKWSAGCQVFKKNKDYEEFMELIFRSLSYYDNSFTYTLLEENDYYE